MADFPADSNNGEVRILITGGNGLIGKYATELLASQNCDVHVISRTARKYADQSGLTFHSVNLLDHDETLKLISEVKPTHLLHLAWETSHGAFWSAPQNLDWVAATMNLAGAFAAAGGRRFVGAGSCAEYDWTSQDLETGNCSEASSRIAPVHLYGIAKDSSRRILESFAANSGFEFAWGRVFFLFDPEEDDRRFVKSIITNLKSGQRASCSSGTQLRDFMHAKDVGAAFAALLMSDTNGPVNIGSGEPLTLGNVARTIGELMNKPELIGLGDLPNRPGEPVRIVADTSKLANDVGFTSPLSLKTRLKECIEGVK